MSYEDIIRAWKDEDYRMSLSEEERAQLPGNPAGLIELSDTELELIGGGYDGGAGGSGGSGGSGGIKYSQQGSCTTNAIKLCC